ncbi:hypothetical protein GUJ93_ZPchr0010g8103 [Zizania palustris]|uniref:Uncharacterized protein n=1 Tax=Zizania palustris TaxID=103762 RepID=A0A8J5WDS4_ZIZPA|nr:hypothetical protein GUJ93_ZPchr0010g8103 [Zizania palustris]
MRGVNSLENQLTKALLCSTKKRPKNVYRNYLAALLSSRLVELVKLKLEGIVPGGGVALLYATKELDKIITAPLMTIVANAGIDGGVVIGKLIEQDNLNLGYDAARGEYVDMIKAGIIDPVKVIRTALQDAASVSLLMTNYRGCSC